MSTHDSDEKVSVNDNTSVNEIDSVTNEDISNNISDDNASVDTSDKAFSKMIEATIAEHRGRIIEDDKEAKACRIARSIPLLFGESNRSKK